MGKEELEEKQGHTGRGERARRERERGLKEEEEQKKEQPPSETEKRTCSETYDKHQKRSFARTARCPILSTLAEFRTAFAVSAGKLGLPPSI